MPELYDQEGFIVRLGAGGSLRWNGLLIKARDCNVWVNDDRWPRVQYIEARSLRVDALGFEGSRHPLPLGAEGRIEVMQVEGKDTVPEIVQRIQSLFADSSVAFTFDHPDTGVEIRRIAFGSCRWEPPSIIPLPQSGRPARNRISVDFKAESYSDAAPT